MEKAKNPFDLRAIPSEELEKILATADQLVKLQVRRQKLQKLRTVERDAEVRERVVVLLAGLDETIERERTLLAALPHCATITPGLVPLAATDTGRVALALHRTHSRWYCALIEEVRAEGAEAAVAYIGYDERETLSAAAVRPLPLLSRERLFREAACAFVDAATGRLHAGVVAEPAGERPAVRRRSDGRVVLVEPGLLLEAECAPEEVEAAAVTILPNDSREVRQRKKKVLKRRAYEARSEEAAELFRQRQRSWLDFKARR